MDTIILDTPEARTAWRLTAPGRLLGGLVTGGTRAERTRLASEIAAAFTEHGLAHVDFGDPDGRRGDSNWDGIVHEADTIAGLNDALTHRFTDPEGPSRYAPSIWNCVLVVEDLVKVLDHPDAGPGLERLIVCGSKVGMAVIGLSSVEPECSEAMSVLRRHNRIALSDAVGVEDASTTASIVV
jgi:hypothetical protein